MPPKPKGKAKAKGRARCNDDIEGLIEALRLDGLTSCA